MGLAVFIGERTEVCVWFEKEIERIVDGHFSHQINRHFEGVCFLRKHQSCLVIALRILLPIDEMLRWLYV